MSPLHKTIFTLSLLSLPLTNAQFISSLPQCVQSCISQSQDDNCQASDIKCLCRASAGNFLPDLITCMHSNCDNDLDNNLLLTPLQLACQLAGVPIPASALRNAENEASSLASQVTATVTISNSASSPNAGSGSTTTAPSSTLSTATVTTTLSGTTIYEIYPVTILSTTTLSGPPISTITPSKSLSPVVITTTNSAGSTYTFWVSNPPVSSGIHTSWIPLTIVSGTSTSVDSTGGGNTNTETTVTTSVVAQETSSSASLSSNGVEGSKTSKSSSPGQSSDSAPFTNTNSSGANLKLGDAWLWIGVMISVCLVWI